MGVAPGSWDTQTAWLPREAGAHVASHEARGDYTRGHAAVTYRIINSWRTRSIVRPQASLPQSAPNSMAASSKAATSSPGTAGLATMRSAPPAGSSPNSVPCSTRTVPCSIGWLA